MKYWLGSMQLQFCCLVALLLLTPLFETPVVLLSLMSLLMIFLLGRDHSFRGLVLLAGGLFIAIGWLSVFVRVQPEWLMVSRAFGVIFMLLILVQMLKKFVFSARISADALFAAASCYLLFGVLWTLLYTMLEQWMPGSFVGLSDELNIAGARWSELIYFSFVTITTLGHGDITPLSQAARVLTVCEAITGVLYLGFIIARLVGIYVTGQAARSMD